MKRSLQQRISFGQKLGLSKAHAGKLARLATPEKIQDYIDTLRVNLEPDGDTSSSVAETMRLGYAHCIEAALLAACALWINGEPPLLMDLRSHRDLDHVVTVYRRFGCWGAISKSNHIALRWRDPVYRDLRELAMSYQHEYTKGARKTLRAYSEPFDLRRYDPKLWVTNKDHCWDIGADLDDCRHYTLITKKQVPLLRRYDKFELIGGELVEYK